MGCQHPYHEAHQHGSTSVVGGWARGAHQRHRPAGTLWAVTGMCRGVPAAPVPAPVGAPNLLLEGVVATLRHPTGCSGGSIPQQRPQGGHLTPSSSGAPSPLAMPAAMHVSAEPPSPAFTPQSLRRGGVVGGVCLLPARVLLGRESMSAGRIWGKSIPPPTKGRLRAGLSGTAHPVAPRAPLIKCFLAPSPAAQPIEGGSPGAMLEHPQCYGEPRIYPQTWSAPGAPKPEGSARGTLAERGGVAPRLAPHGPAAPTGDAGSCPHSGSVPSAQGPGGGGGGPCSLSPFAEASWLGPWWGRWVEGAGWGSRGGWGAAGSGDSAIRRGLS